MAIFDTFLEEEREELARMHEEAARTHPRDPGRREGLLERRLCELLHRSETLRALASCLEEHCGV